MIGCSLSTVEAQKWLRFLYTLKARQGSFAYIYKKVPQHESHHRRKYEDAALKI